ncbi:cytosine deaminase [Rhodosalinus halophilus]|uniref:cytosine deaminase n=1 Tax=Rhodosalinus halophilus TaxID=2259333 RepID=UPI0013146CDE|nr:cytosine deaminase [Rhodosalinus halophilus]
MTGAPEAQAQDAPRWPGIAAALHAAPPRQLRNLRIPAAVTDLALPAAGDGLRAAEIEIVQGRLFVRPPGTLPEAAALDLGRRIVWPAPVDCHTHLDKGQVWPRTPNPDGSFEGALATAPTDLRFASDADLRRRAEFMLRCAEAHGTRAIRSHVDAGPDGRVPRLPVLEELAQDWRGRLDVQLCPFAGLDGGADALGVLATTARRTGTLSLFLQRRSGLDTLLDTIFALAERYGLALDFHADETLDPASHCLRAVARAALRARFEGPVLVGHCCALSVQPETEVQETLDLVARAGLGIVALPLCNAYLQDRAPGRSPRQRGVAPVKEIAARGIPVALASDNVRDAFYAYGDLDVPGLFRDALRMMQLDHPVGDWPAAVTRTAADLIGRPDLGRLRDGNPADLILFNARNWSEFAARPQSDRVVLRRGAARDTTPPEFPDLDDLKGMTA